MKRIVLTGPPCSGKTSISTALAPLLPDYVVVPEAATQVYSADATRWDLLDLDGRKDCQRRIYHLQLRQEEDYANQYPGKNLLLDRGTLDGAVYWPDGPDAYWREMSTTLAAELARYDRVILMETAATLGVYGLETNPCRFEDAAGAIANGNALAELWGKHRDLIVVRAFASLEDKIAAVKAILPRS
jgi:predicted ATPase